LPERHKLFVQARYAQLEKDDPAESIALLKSLVSRYPDDERAYMALSNAYIRLSETEKRLEILERGVAALPRAGAIYNLYGYALLDAGRYPEGIRAFEAYARLLPEEPNPHDSLAEAYLITGQPERAVAQYTRALEISPSFLTSHMGRSFAYAVLGRYDEFLEDIETLKESPDLAGVSPASLYFVRSLGLSRVGRYEEAGAERREGIEVARRLDAPGRHAALELLAGLHALERGKASGAADATSRIEALAAEMDSVSRRYLTVAALLVAGAAEARSGDLDAARRRLEIQREIMDEREDAEAWWHHSLEGEIALAAGDLDAAETAFAAGEPESKMTFTLGPPRGTPWAALSNSLPFHDGRARVRKAQGDLPEAIRIYRDLLTPDMSSKWTAWLEPRYVLRLARLLHESGDLDGARAEYEHFLVLWKDADPGLPEIDEARAYLAN
jgi:tetratricopeptide (TPR) repeat protein